MDKLNPKMCAPKTAAMVACGAWTLWTGRNNRRHGRKVWELGATARYIVSLLEDLISLKMPPPTVKLRTTVPWRPPEEGWVKINTDATFHMDTCSGSAGVVIRNHHDQVLATATRWLDDVADALTAEALAAKEGMELAVENGYDRVVLEVDCKGLKNLLDDKSGFMSSIGGICLDVTELGTSFGEFRVEWVCREANSVAHVCASMASATDRVHFWLDCIPEWLEGLAAADCNPMMNQ